MLDRRKKLEHMEDESEVMRSLLLSVKDRIKMGWNIVPFCHYQAVMQHTDKKPLSFMFDQISLISMCKPWSLIESNWLFDFVGTVFI